MSDVHEKGKGMRAKHIKIENLKGFESFETDMPALCILAGDHASGKTSFEEILKYALGRRSLAEKGSRGVEHDPGMLKIGAERGEAVITFDDESPIEHLRLIVTPDSTERKIKTRGSKRWAPASTEIDAFAEAISYNPMSLKDMSAKERVAAALKVMPIMITKAEIETAVGDGAASFICGTPSLDAINQIYSHIEIGRRDTNRDAKSLESHASELETALPPESADGQDWSAVADDLVTRIEALKKTETDLIARLNSEGTEVKETQERIKAASTVAIDKDINARIAELERERALRKDALNSSCQQVVDSRRHKSALELEQLRDEINPEISKLTGEAAAARTQAEARQRTAGTRDAAARARQTAKEKEAISERMTQALARLAKLKSEVAGRMKIPNITIESAGPGFEVDMCRIQDGKLVPFSLFNDSDKDLICLRIAVLARGAYGLVCVDEISHYTDERREKVLLAAKSYCREYGMQFCFGESVSAPLKVIDGAAV